MALCETTVCRHDFAAIKLEHYTRVSEANAVRFTRPWPKGCIQHVLLGANSCADLAYLDTLYKVVSACRLCACMIYPQFTSWVGKKSGH